MLSILFKWIEKAKYAKQTNHADHLNAPRVFKHQYIMISPNNLSFQPFFLNIIFKVGLSRAFELQPVRNAYFSMRNSHEMLISDAQLQTVACHEILTAPFKLKAVSQIIEVHSYSCNCCNLCLPMHKQGKRPRVATTTCKCVFCYTQRQPKWVQEQLS